MYQTDPTTTEIRLRDYTPPAHLVEHTELTVELLSPEEVVVRSTLHLRPNPDGDGQRRLVLDGAPEHSPADSETPTMALEALAINGQALAADAYRRAGEQLIIPDAPAEPFTLDCQTRINPRANRALNGLYVSGESFITQCEPHGFRNITFYPDRPDVLARFTTTLIAEAGKFAQLLSNGNFIERTTLPDGREAARWEDPFPKPCYLFALVAGNMEALHGSYTTGSGREVALVVYADAAHQHKTRHAMDSLKEAMAWDEQRFGLEYDLNLFQIVAADDFNFGAMENKGLNIFNAQAILADPQTATDDRYEYIQAVVGHEYFHNWSGNRVTCRDWFQLSLKEGLTVFRDSEFTADLNSRPRKRIDDVAVMRSLQFPEDAGGMAHPIRPEAVASIENFYTPTVYEKGAEVIRMLHTMLGEDAFQTGCELYFSRHDGQAVRTEEFIAAMQEAANRHELALDLSQFEASWYHQAGTPILDISDAYDEASGTYTLYVRQHTPATPGQPEKQPFHIPLRIGLLDEAGNDYALADDLLHVREERQEFVFTDIPARPLPSLLRGWSAPVRLRYPYSREQLARLMADDNDGFNRWDAGQQLMVDVLQEMVGGGEPDAILIDALRRSLMPRPDDAGLLARSLSLPAISYLIDLCEDGTADPLAIYRAHSRLRANIGQALERELLTCFEAQRESEQRPYQWTPDDAGQRALKLTCLGYLVRGNPQAYMALASEQFERKDNMTEMRSAWRHLLDQADAEQRETVIRQFYTLFQHNPLALNHWFADQAAADQPAALETVRELMAHPAYDASNPNKVRALIGGFAGNIPHFHAEDGSGYRFIAEQIIALDRYNPMMAAGLAKRFSSAAKFAPACQEQMTLALEQMRAEVHSVNVREIVEKSLARIEP